MLQEGRWASNIESGVTVAGRRWLLMSEETAATAATLAVGGATRVSRGRVTQWLLWGDGDDGGDGGDGGDNNN
jgi:hypothetical protein